jgi:flavin-dependent dehydrogenase
MSSLPFDIVTVGGGLGASAFAGAMARQGMHVLILEKETQFRDRVRGGIHRGLGRRRGERAWNPRRC